MSTSNAILVVIAIVFIVLVWRDYRSRESILVGGRQWSVLRHYDNNAEAARLLASTHAKMVRFLAHMKEKYHINETDEDIADCTGHTAMITSEPHRIADALLSNYNPDVFYENEPGHNGTSYTLNKGTAMYICLRSATDKDQLVCPDMLLFVMLHEASHIANYNGWGHDTRFWRVFKFILQNAVECGIYRPHDYRRHPRDYCGLRVDYNPLLDASLPDIL